MLQTKIRLTGSRIFYQRFQFTKIAAQLIAAIAAAAASIGSAPVFGFSSLSCVLSPEMVMVTVSVLVLLSETFSDTSSGSSELHSRTNGLKEFTTKRIPSF